MAIRHILAAAAIATVGATAASAAVIDLGFSLDESGSVGAGNFDTTRDALAAALGQIPTTGADQYRLAVTAFSDSVTTVIPPTIVTASNLSTLQDSVRAEIFSNGSTNTAGAIDDLLSQFMGAGGLSSTTIFNITTDGQSNSQFSTENSALAAYNAGVDGISFEAINLNSNALNNLLRVSSLGTTGVLGNAALVTDANNLPDVTTSGFVVDVKDFGAYAAAINSKIGQVIDDTTTDPSVVPLPAGLPLLLAGLGAFGVIRRKQNA